MVIRQLVEIDKGVPIDIGLDFGEIIIITRLFCYTHFLEAIVFLATIKYYLIII